MASRSQLSRFYQDKNVITNYRAIKSKKIFWLLLLIVIVIYLAALFFIAILAFMPHFNTLTSIQWFCVNNYADTQRICVLGVGRIGIGLVAIGQISIGFLSIGQLAIGLVSIGQTAFSLLVTLLAQFSISLYTCAGFLSIDVIDALFSFFAINGLAPLLWSGDKNIKYRRRGGNLYGADRFRTFY